MPDLRAHPPSRPLLARLVALGRVDLDPDHGQPALGRVALATAVAVVGSLVADAVLVAVGTAVFPATAHYSHFRFPDYGRLTVAGVVVACVGWPIVSRVTSAPRWVFLRLAVLITLVLFLPDVWILLHGQPAQGVAVLMAMHLAIALVTYNALVRLAPVPPPPPTAS